MDLPRCQPSLAQYARTKDAILQKVVAKVIYCMADVRELRYRARHLGMNDVLKYIKENAADREAWDMADQGNNNFKSNIFAAPFSHSAEHVI